MFKKIKIYTQESYINVLVRYNNKYYTVSDDGYGCNIYTCDKRGKITNWTEIVRLDDKMLGDIVRNKTCFSFSLKNNLTPATLRVIL
jgi:hypothetical protein